MTQEQNDLEQLIKCRRELANVYKTQATDNLPDNGNLTTLNNVILGINKVIAYLESHKAKE